MNIEAIILDIGGVIWLPNDSPISDKWASRCGLDVATFDSIVYGSEWGEQALIGAITRKAIWVNIGDKLNLSGDDLLELEADYWDGKWDTILLDYCRTLKPQYRLGIISDAYEGAREAVHEWVNEYLFEVIVFSAEEKNRKPDPRIYQRALARLNIEASKALFVDDRVKNVEGAKQVGMHALQYTGFSKFLTDLEEYIGEG